MCQAVHAAIEFALANTLVVADWHGESNSLVVLVVADELRLSWLCDDVALAGLSVVRFHEPDLDGSLTAAAFEPAAQRLVSHLPLALKPRKEVKK